MRGSEQSDTLSKRRGPIVDPRGVKGGANGRSSGAERPRGAGPLLVFTLLVLAALAVVPFALLRPRESSYRLLSWSAAPVTRATIAERVQSPGTVVPQDSQEVLARVDGTLDALSVREGDDVTRGQLLGRLSSPALEQARQDAREALQAAVDKRARARLDGAARRAEARSRLAAAESEVASAQTALRRAEALYAVGGESRVNVETLGNKLAAARRELNEAGRAARLAEATARLDEQGAAQALASARATLSRAEAALGRAAKRAPIAGRVVEIAARGGQDVARGGKLLTITSLQGLNIEGQVDEAAAARVNIGQTVRVSIADARFSSRVRAVAAQAVKGQNGSSVKIEVRPDDPPPKLLPGASATLDILVGERFEVPTLPRGQFLSTGDERLAYVLVGPERAERREVTFGASDAERIEVMHGLTVGERVIVGSYEAFKDKPSIQVVPSGELQ